MNESLQTEKFKECPHFLDNKMDANEKMTRGKTRRYSINYKLIYGKEIKSRPQKKNQK